MIADSQAAGHAEPAALYEPGFGAGPQEGSPEQCVYEAASWHVGGGQILYLRARRANEARRSRLLVFVAIVALALMSLGFALVLESLGYLL